MEDPPCHRTVEMEMRNIYERGDVHLQAAAD